MISKLIRKLFFQWYLKATDGWLAAKAGVVAMPGYSGLAEGSDRGNIELHRFLKLVNNKTLSIAAVIFSLLSGNATSSSGQTTACALFLNQTLIKTVTSDVEFNLEEKYGIESGRFTHSYESMRSLESSCAPGSIDAVPPFEIKSPWDAPDYIDVSTGVHNGSPWVQFVYPAIDEEYGPGLSSSIVFYSNQGTPTSTILVSSYHAWDGAKVSSSRITGFVLEICTQTIDPYSYTEFGDIDGELDEPVRSPCEISHIDLSSGSEAPFTPVQ